MIKLVFIQENYGNGHKGDLYIDIVSQDQLLFYGFNNDLRFETDEQYLSSPNYLFAREKILKQFLIDHKL